MTTKARRAVGVLAAALLAPGQTPTFKASSNLVIVNVTVRDKSGKLVEGLKKEDFQVFEDDKAQVLSVFEIQHLATDSLPPVEPPAPVKGAPARPRVTKEKEEPPALAPGEVRYKDKRLMVMFFDFSAMAVAEQVRAQKAATAFLSKSMTASDLVSIMTFTNKLKVVEEFTDDREQLITAIQNFKLDEMSDATTDGGAPDPDDDDTNTLFVADETEFNIFNTDRRLSALEAAVRNLGAMPEKKALVYISNGVGKTGMENQSQLRATINEAVKANVAFYPIDARGLQASAPAGDASVASPRGTGIFSGSQQKGRRDKFNDEQETLYTLAADTGGKALLDSNDLTIGMTQVQKDVNSYYIVGYYSTNADPDGKYRKIRVQVPSIQGVKLDYRRGYYASKQWTKFNLTDKERQLEDAIGLGNPVTDLPISLEADYFRLNKDSYFSPVALKIPGAEIVTTAKGSTELDFLGQVKDKKGKTVGSVRDTIKVKFTEADAALLAKRYLEYDTAFTLNPGEYKLKFVARENQTGKMGTFESKFIVPDLSAKDVKGLRLSSVVWSNQRLPLEEAKAMANAKEFKKKSPIPNPLVHDGQKLIPSITHTFHRTQPLFVYAEVYDPGLEAQTQMPSIAATLAIYRGKTKAFESRPLRFFSAPEGRGQTIPVQVQTPLAKLKPGQYMCQLTVVDEYGKKFAFARSPLVLLP